MQGRVKLPCMRYMLLLIPRSIVSRFVIVPTVTVSDCLFHGVRGFCVNVRVPLQLFSLISPSVWGLSIVTNGCASSDWSLGPMLMCVRLGDVCVMMGSSLVFLVFCLCVDKKKRFVISILSQHCCHRLCFSSSLLSKSHIGRVFPMGKLHIAYASVGRGMYSSCSSLMGSEGETIGPKGSWKNLVKNLCHCGPVGMK